MIPCLVIAQYAYCYSST